MKRTWSAGTPSHWRAQHVGNLGRGLKPSLQNISPVLLNSARRKPRKGIETGTAVLAPKLLHSARRKPRKGIETSDVRVPGELRYSQHVGNLGRGLKHSEEQDSLRVLPQHVGNLGRGLKLRRALDKLRNQPQHVGNLGRGLKHMNDVVVIIHDGSARRKPRKGIETFKLTVYIIVSELSTSETSEGD